MSKWDEFTFRDSDAQDVQPVQLRELVDLLEADVAQEHEQGPDLELLAETTRQAAYQEGFEAGFQQATQEAGQILESLSRAEGERQQHLIQLARQLEEEAVALALAMAAELVDDHIRHHPESIIPIAQRALDYVTEAELVYLYSHPEDASLLQAAWNRLHIPKGKEVQLRTDPTLTRGSCRVESEIGDVNATRETRLAILYERIEEMRHERSE